MVPRPESGQDSARSTSQYGTTGSVHSVNSASGKESSATGSRPHHLQAKNQQFPSGAVDSQSAGQTLLKKAHASYNAGNMHETVKLCNEYSERLPNCSEILLLHGAALYQLGNYAECIAANTAALSIEPDFAEAYGNIGNALKMTGDTDGAVCCYQHAIRLKPRFCDPYNNLAGILMSQGKLPEAASLFQQAIALNPQLVDAHANLGNLLRAQGQFAEAKRCLLRAIAIKPSFGLGWSNFAALLREEGDLSRATYCYEQAVHLKPNVAEILCNLGNCYKDSGRLDKAEAAYARALDILPNFAIAHANLGSVYYETGRFQLAVMCYKKAISLQSCFPDAYNNLGNALKELGYVNEAFACYQCALAQKNDHPHALNNMGNSLKDAGRGQEAAYHYERAVASMPNFAAAHSNLAALLREQGRMVEAAVHYQEAIRANPFFADAYSNLGNTYKDLGRLDDAIHSYGIAVSICPEHADAHSNLAGAFKDTGRHEEAITHYRAAMQIRPGFDEAFCNLAHSLVFVCDWQEHKTLMQRLERISRDQISCGLLPSVQPFHCLAYPLPLDLITDISRAYAAKAVQAAAILPSPQQPFDLPKRSPGERIRVGFVSSDFTNHPFAHLTQSVYGMLDSTKFEVFCFSLSPECGTEYRARIRASVEHFIDITSMPSNEAAAMINQQYRIHVLFNLNGYTKGARNDIFVLRPCPVQVSYMGFCGTMGDQNWTDYLLTDAMTSPPEYSNLYCEKLAYMPHSYFVNDHLQSFPQCLVPGTTPQRSQYGLPNDKVILCNFNQLYKIDPIVFDSWCRILKSCPNAVLWLLKFPVVGEARIRAAALERGVPSHQIIFTDVAVKEEHVRRGACADLFVDTLMCNAHTTGCDILWSGVPMVTCPQKKMSCRVAASLLHAIGCPELVASSVEQYESIIVDLVRNTNKLQACRQKVERNRLTEPLFDTLRWTKNLEVAIEMMWDRHASGLKPESFHVKENARSIPAIPAHRVEVQQQVARIQDQVHTSAMLAAQHSSTAYQHCAMVTGVAAIGQHPGLQHQQPCGPDQMRHLSPSSIAAPPQIVAYPSFPVAQGQQHQAVNIGFPVAETVRG